MAADAPAKKNITLLKGGAFQMRLVVTNQDGTPRALTGYTSKMQVRADVDDVTALLTITPTVDTANGYVDVLVTKAQTLGLTVESAVWDVWIDNGSSTSPEYIAFGDVTVRKMVTQ